MIFYRSALVGHSCQSEYFQENGHWKSYAAIFASERCEVDANTSVWSCPSGCGSMTRTSLDLSICVPLPLRTTESVEEIYGCLVQHWDSSTRKWIALPESGWCDMIICSHIGSRCKGRRASNDLQEEVQQLGIRVHGREHMIQKSTAPANRKDH